MKILFSKGINQKGKNFFIMDFENSDAICLDTDDEGRIKVTFRNLESLIESKLNITFSGNIEDINCEIRFGQQKKIFNFQEKLNLETNLPASLQIRIDMIKMWINSLPYTNTWQFDVNF